MSLRLPRSRLHGSFGAGGERVDPPPERGFAPREAQKQKKRRTSRALGRLRPRQIHDRAGKEGVRGGTRGSPTLTPPCRCRRALRTWTNQVGALPARVLRPGTNSSSLRVCVGSRYCATPRTGSSAPIVVGNSALGAREAPADHRPSAYAELGRQRLSQPELRAGVPWPARDDLREHLGSPVPDVDLRAADEDGM